MKKRLSTSAGLIVVLCAQAVAAQEVTPPPPAASPWSVAVVMGARYHWDGSRDAFSRETVGFASGVIVGRALTSPALPVELALELGFEAESNQGSLHQAWATRITSLAPSAGLSLRWRARPWLLPYVRVHAGATWHEVSLEANDGGGFLDGSAWGFQGSAALGLMFQTGTFAREGAFRAVRFAATIEGGAVYAAPVGITVQPRAPTDERVAADRLPASAVRVGDLDTSGSFVRVGVGFRF